MDSMILDSCNLLNPSRMRVRVPCPRLLFHGFFAASRSLDQSNQPPGRAFQIPLTSSGIKAQRNTVHGAF